MQDSGDAAVGGTGLCNRPGTCVPFYSPLFRRAQINPVCDRSGVGAHGLHLFGMELDRLGGRRSPPAGEGHSALADSGNRINDFDLCAHERRLSLCDSAPRDRRFGDGRQRRRRSIFLDPWAGILAKGHGGPFRVGMLSATMLSNPRTVFAMGRDGLFFRWVGRVHPKYQTPSAAILFESIVGCGFIVWGSFDEILNFLSVPLVVMFAMTVSTIFVFRIQAPRSASAIPMLGLSARTGFLRHRIFVDGVFGVHQQQDCRASRDSGRARRNSRLLPDGLEQEAEQWRACGTGLMRFQLE